MTLPRAVARKAIAIKNELNAFDREYWSSDDGGYCKHGTYVGGCGIDWMCGYCESGYSNYEIALSAAWDEMHRVRTFASRELWDKLFRDHAEVFDAMTPEQQKDVVHKFIDFDKALKG
jgi:hypothetical protein